MPKLPHIFEKKDELDEKPKEFFWALLIWDEQVKTAIWTVEEGRAKVVTLGEPQNWDGLEVGGLIKAVDDSFTSCLEQFEGQGKEPDKVIFGLPDSWTEKESIKKKYQEYLQKLCQRLEITPVGFVSPFDAIAFHLKKVEGIPLSAILIRPDKKKLLIAVCQVGKILKVEEVVASGDLALDTCEGLLRFKVELLPSRMLLFNGEDMEEARQSLTAFHWEAERASGKKLPFLHFPKIEILPSSFDINAVSLAGGAEVAKSLGFSIAQEKKEVQDETEKPQKEKEEDIFPETNLGFVKNEDVLKTRKKEVEEKSEKLEKFEEPTKEVETVDIEEFKREKKEAEKEPSFDKPSFIIFLKQKISGFSFPSLSGFLPGRPFLAVFLLASFLFLTGAFLWFIWYYPKATITFVVAPETLKEEISLTVDPTQEILNKKERILPAKLVEVEKSGQREAETTGEKTVGEKAKGEVTIYNRTSEPQVFSKGTILIGPGKLNFSLQREVAVASKTPDLESGVDKWGEATVEVEAVDIGASYNLASGSQFSVEEFPTSSFLAKNQASFTGGTSRQIQVVSQEDQEKLVKDLKEDLEKEAKGDLLANISQQERLIESSITSQVIDKKFSHKVAEETKTFSLKLTVKASAFVYEEDDFLEIAQEVLGEKVPENFELRKNEIEASFAEEEKTDEGSFLFKVFLKADLLPKIDERAIFEKIRGKRPVLAKEYFEKLPGFTRSEISFKPRLPSFLQFIPRSQDKIRFEVKSL